MKYSFIVILAIVLLSSCRKDDTDSPLTPMLSSDFPSTIGSQWVYKRTDSTTNVVDTFTVKIVGQTTMPNGQIAKLWEYTYATRVDTNYYVIVGDTLKQYNYFLSNLNYPNNTIIFPFIVGSFYRFNLSFDSVIERKDIIVNNILFLGSFHTLKRTYGLEYEANQEFWYEKRVGLIKQYARNVSYDYGTISSKTIELLYTNIR